jgi:hypothetical protein
MRRRRVRSVRAGGALSRLRVSGAGRRFAAYCKPRRAANQQQSSSARSRGSQAFICGVKLALRILRARRRPLKIQSRCWRQCTRALQTTACQLRSPQPRRWRRGLVDVRHAKLHEPARESASKSCKGHLTGRVDSLQHHCCPPAAAIHSGQASPVPWAAIIDRFPPLSKMNRVQVVVLVSTFPDFSLYLKYRRGSPSAAPAGIYYGAQSRRDRSQRRTTDGPCYTPRRARPPLWRCNTRRRSSAPTRWRYRRQLAGDILGKPRFQRAASSNCKLSGSTVSFRRRSPRVRHADCAGCHSPQVVFRLDGQTLAATAIWCLSTRRRLKSEARNQLCESIDSAVRALSAYR